MLSFQVGRQKFCFKFPDRTIKKNQYLKKQFLKEKMKLLQMLTRRIHKDQQRRE